MGLTLPNDLQLCPFIRLSMQVCLEPSSFLCRPVDFKALLSPVFAPFSSSSGPSLPFEARDVPLLYPPGLFAAKLSISGMGHPFRVFCTALALSLGLSLPRLTCLLSASFLLFSVVLSSPILCMRYCHFTCLTCLPIRSYWVPNSVVHCCISCALGSSLIWSSLLSSAPLPTLFFLFLCSLPIRLSRVLAAGRLSLRNR